MSTAPRTDAIVAGGRCYVIGYLVVASMMVTLWLALYGSAFKGPSSGNCFKGAI